MHSSSSSLWESRTQCPCYRAMLAGTPNSHRHQNSEVKAPYGIRSYFLWLYKFWPFSEKYKDKTNSVLCILSVGKPSSFQVLVA